MRMIRWPARLAMTLLAVGIGCMSPETEQIADGSLPPDGSDTAGTPPPDHVSPDPLPTDSRPPAPWSAPPLARAQIPAVYIQEWSEAPNRAECALIVPGALGEYGDEARPRAADFSGGWAVAYDLPELRSAFGVAGTGSRADEPTYQGWPNRLEWIDGSVVDYGLEGGTGPNHLAYLKIAGQDCLYNVWSRLGQRQLEDLLFSLRLVAPEA